MTVDLHSARFPAVAHHAGHYESFYLKLADPQRSRGAWIRYTVLKRPGRPALGSVWCVLWPGGDAAPQARKVTLAPPELESGGAELIRIGANRLGAVDAAGSIDGGAWTLEYRPTGTAFPYLPRSWMYRTPLPRTKAASLSPYTTFHGQITVGAHTVTVEGWPGMVGHNWGAEHAERWIWIHGAGFPGASDAWLDAIVGRIKVGRLTLPWVANGGLWLDGRLYRLGGPAALRGTSVSAEPHRCQVVLPGQGVVVRGQVTAPPALTTAWQYADPSGGHHFTCNCSVASLTLSVQDADGLERAVQLPGGAAYELGARERPSTVTVQPFPDP